MQLVKDKMAHANSIFTVNKAKELPHGQFETILSNEDIDRHGEIVSIKGIEIPSDQVIKMYYNHETRGVSLPIGKWVKIWKKDGKLMGLGQIDMEDDFAVKIYKKILGGFLDSMSIGFMPLDYDGDTATWTKSRLHEASVVAEPANTGAVVTQKALGFTEKEFQTALKVKLKEVENVVSVKAINKGKVEDVLTTPKKYEVMEPYYDVIWAFQDAFYDKDTDVTEFSTLLTEAIELLQTVADGTYDPEKTKTFGSQTEIEETEVESALKSLKSRVGAVEEAVKASTEKPSIKSLISVRLAGKEVDKSAEALNTIVKIKLKESQNE